MEGGASGGPCINLGTDNKTVTGCKIIAKGKMEGVELEYIDVVNGASFEPWNDGPIGPEAFAIVAAEVGGVRLIDNCALACS